MTFRETEIDRAMIEIIRAYLMMVMGRHEPPPAADAIRYALRLAADAVGPVVREEK